MKWWHWIGISFLLASMIAGWIGYKYYKALFAPNISTDGSGILYIYPETTIDSLEKKLSEYLISPASFERAAWIMDFREEDLKKGRYNIQPTSTNRELINKLRSGLEDPVNVVIYNERDIERISGKISQYIMMDSLEVLQCFQSSQTLRASGYEKDSLLTLFIPNTYQMYWSVSCDKLTSRLLKEHDSFWSEDGRRDKAQRLGLTTEEVYILASIVDRETIAGREKPIVARLYLNRLKIGMPLQADPTVVFANKIFETRRVLYEHLKTDSPYNTYLYAGLPPGPIGIASISGIDAVLNPDENEYLYMVAKPDNSGLHNFSTNLRTHNRFANEYRRWLNQRGL